MDYFDNGIICNLIEHVSYHSLTSETSLFRVPQHPSVCLSTALLGKNSKGEQKMKGSLGNSNENVNILKDQVSDTLIFFPFGPESARHSGHAG